MSATTIKQVARQANVSIATVSRVLNNSGPVNERTRRRVEAVAKLLRYTPNAIGRSLSTRRTEAIGLLLPDLHGEFFSEVIRGTDLAAQKRRYHLFVSSSHNHPEEIEAALRMMRGRVDGVIIMSPHIDADSLKANFPRPLPVVLLNCYTRDDSFDTLTIDNYTGAFEMVRHLAAHGHRRIAIIKGTPGNFDAEERLRGYRAAMAELDATLTETIEMAGDFSEISGYDAAKSILTIQARPTAIFAANDSMAIGAMSALSEAGVGVPGDIAVAGFDDIPIAHFMKPSLTSVQVEISRLGILAVERLVGMLSSKNDHHHQKEQIVLPTQVLARESCGCQFTKL